MITGWADMKHPCNYLRILGEQLEDVLEQLIRTGMATRSKQETPLSTRVKTIPEIMKDVTDRNRTSPFAFTGNKFEFRMVGSQDSVSQPNVCVKYNCCRGICRGV